MRGKELDRLYGILILVLCILFLGGFGAYALVTGKVITGIEIVLTALVTIITTILGYLWGASAKPHSDGKED